MKLLKLYFILTTLTFNLQNINVLILNLYFRFSVYPASVHCIQYTAHTTCLETVQQVLNGYVHCITLHIVCTVHCIAEA